jgi:hypothetical protein
MAKSEPTMTENSKSDVTTTETGVWGGVGKKMRIMISTALKGLRYVVGRTERKIIVEDEDSKSDVTTTED